MIPPNVLAKPDRVTVWTDDDRLRLPPLGPRQFGGGGVDVAFAPTDAGAAVRVSGPNVGLRYVILRWACALPAGVRILGDHWERGYGDLEWRGYVAERPMPWYCLVHRGDVTWGAGVMTGAASMAHWQIDPTGVSLTLDVRCGARGVQLGDRALTAATIVQHHDAASPFTVAGTLAKSMCPNPRVPTQPVYGGNDWYYIYGLNTAETCRADAARIAELSPDTSNRPFSVIDAGWQPLRYEHDLCCIGGPNTHGNDRFGDMAALAAGMRDAGSRPGIWVRLLPTSEALPESWLLPEAPFNGRCSHQRMMDPTVPEVLEHVRQDMQRLVGWGYELVKHDFSTWDLAGQWGYQMTRGWLPGGAAWTFADPSVTSAEAIVAFYRAIRDGAGQAIVIGCNTIGHLAAGLVDLQRTGDDTSGRDWERTRKMGVNTLAFRMNQHNTFFACDADCVGLTDAVPWALNRQWLELLAGSGTPLFVSADPNAIGDDQRRALREAFARAAKPQAAAEPLDWMATTCPARWRIGGSEQRFDWYGGGEASLLTSGM